MAFDLDAFRTNFLKLMAGVRERMEELDRLELELRCRLEALAIVVGH